jgi:TRAP-type transport system periplasmic protein
MKRIGMAAMCVAILAFVAVAGLQAQQAKNWTLKYNCLEVPEHPQGVTETKFAEKIKELSGGTMTVQTYFSGTLFNQQGQVVALMNGDLDLSTIAFQDISPYVPTSDMFAAPYAFTSYDHMKKVFAQDSKVAADFYKMVSDKCNYTPLAAMTQGSRIINAKKAAPIKTPADMKGVILRMPNAPSWISAGQALGASVTPIAYAETYTALQTGIVDAQDNPLPGTYSSKFYEVTK